MSIRLLHCKSLHFKVFPEAQVPPYAILSHTWNASEEVTLQDMLGPSAARKGGYSKITGSCRLALSHRIEYVWIDTCCIDKANAAETAEAIRSMYRWYQNAAVCYVYLSDLKSSDADALRRCAWFTRGWTLQEMLAPYNVEFFDSNWKPIGSKGQLANLLSEITLIPVSAILGQEPLGHYSVAQRMSWASGRITTRIEDTAYCLLGIFDVDMVLFYGEGPMAFQRLQEEIISRTVDLTVFAWLPAPPLPGTAPMHQSTAHHQTLAAYSPLLASSPLDFKLSYQTTQFSHDDTQLAVTNRGLRITTSLVLLPMSDMKDNPHVRGKANISASGSGAGATAQNDGQQYRYVLPLGSSKNTASDVGIWLKKVGPGLYLREKTPSLVQLSGSVAQGAKTTDIQSFYILLNPNAIPSTAVSTPMVSAHLASGASTTARNSLCSTYHPRMFPGGIYIPSFADRGIQIVNYLPSGWDERTRIYSHPESPNDVVAFSCTSLQGFGGGDKLSFGVLIDFRDRSQGPRCMVINRLSPESSLVFLQTEPMKWHVLEHNLCLEMGSNALQFDSNSGRKYDVSASIVRGNVQIDEHVVPMSTLDINIIALGPGPNSMRKLY